MRMWSQTCKDNQGLVVGGAGVRAREGACLPVEECGPDVAHGKCFLFPDARGVVFYTVVMNGQEREVEERPKDGNGKDAEHGQEKDGKDREEKDGQDGKGNDGQDRKGN